MSSHGEWVRCWKCGDMRLEASPAAQPARIPGEPIVFDFTAGEVRQGGRVLSGAAAQPAPSEPEEVMPMYPSPRRADTKGAAETAGNDRARGGSDSDSVAASGSLGAETTSDETVAVRECGCPIDGPHKFSCRFAGAETAPAQQPCMFPRCVEGEKPPYCGQCGDREMPYEDEWRKHRFTPPAGVQADAALIRDVLERSVPQRFDRGGKSSGVYESALAALDRLEAVAGTAGSE